MPNLEMFHFTSFQITYMYFTLAYALDYSSKMVCFANTDNIVQYNTNTVTSGGYIGGVCPFFESALICCSETTFRMAISCRIFQRYLSC